MRLHRGLAPLVVGALAATTASFVSTAPAQAAAGWKTALTHREARAQVCATVAADGSAVVKVRMDNRWASATYSAGIASVRANGRPDRTLVTTRFAAPGRVSAAASYRGLTAADSFFVDIAQRFDEGAGIVRTSPEPFVVGEQKPC